MVNLLIRKTLYKNHVYIEDHNIFYHFLSKQTLVEIMCTFFLCNTLDVEQKSTARHHFVPLRYIHFKYGILIFLFVSKNFLIVVLFVFNCFLVFKTLNHQYFLNYTLLSLSSLSTFLSQCILETLYMKKWEE